MAHKKQGKFFPPETRSLEIAKAIGSKIADILKDLVQGGEKTTVMHCNTKVYRKNIK